MAKGLYDVWTEASKRLFFRDKRGSTIIPDSSDKYYRIVGFGSLYCEVHVYDKNGKFIEQVMRSTDTLHNCELVPKKQLPKKLRFLRISCNESKLAEKTQSQQDNHPDCDQFGGRLGGTATLYFND